MFVEDIQGGRGLAHGDKFLSPLRRKTLCQRLGLFFIVQDAVDLSSASRPRTLMNGDGDRKGATHLQDILRFDMGWRRHGGRERTRVG